jgi:hypothetical protein
MPQNGLMKIFWPNLDFPVTVRKHSTHCVIRSISCRPFGSNERMIAQLVGHVRGSTTAMTTYRKDADVGEQLA